MYLDESDISCLLPEALTANVEAVLANETGLVGANAADRSVSLKLTLRTMMAEL